MPRTLTFLRPAAAVVILLLASTAIVACGGSGGSGSSTASAKSSGLKYASCMRAHGVPDYPDPEPGKSDAAIRTASDKVTVRGQTLSESWPVVQAAIGKCQAVVDQSLPKYSTTQLAKVQAAALAMSKCMRAHGLNYPDLKVMAGPGGHGVAVAFPRGSTTSGNAPQFKKDNAVCSRLLNKALPGKKG